MMITERVQTDNATRVIPMKRSSNIRLSNSYDPNCDNNSRISDHIGEQSMNNISLNLNQSTEYINANSMSTKKDRCSLESNIDGRNQSNIRLCNSQSNDINKPDTTNRQFSPWSAPVRNRVVARVVPYPHTSSNAPNVSHLNSNLASKFNQNTHSIRGSSSTVPQNLNRNIHKSYASYPEKDIPANKQDNLLPINHNYFHLINDRDTDPQKRRPNYNQPVTYRVKNPDGTPKSFDLRNSSFGGGRNEKSRSYRFSEIPEVADKPVTAAEVFGEDFSDFSDNDSSPSYASRTAVMITDSRKRKSKVNKCKSPSSDSSSTMSVLSSEKQNRFVRVSKPHFHSKKTSVHVKSINRNKKMVKLKSCSSSDEQRNTMHNSKISRHQMKFSIKEKPEKKNISMKPLTVNVSLTNFEDDVVESDDSSSRSTENSSENSSKVSIIQNECLNLKNKQAPMQINKRKLIIENPQKYRNNDHHLSSSSDNEYNSRRFQVNTSKSKSYVLNEHENRKMSKYIHDRTYKENKYTTKPAEGSTHNTKVDNDHYTQRQINYNSSSHNIMVGRQFREKDSVQLYRDKNVYIPRSRQRSDSPPLKRQKLKTEEIDKTKRISDKNKSSSSQIVSRHNFNKHDHQKIHQELSSDAAFQKEFDEFKRDQAGDISQGSVQRKCNSSIMSSVSSTGTKSFTSFKKFKSKKQESSKYSMYDTIDSKNIFQIDMNNINIYESMYDKVKRRAQKQAESKINQHSGDINEQRNKRKSKTIFKESKHALKDEKSYHKRHKKSRDRQSRSSSLYSRTSSPLVDEVLSNYSSKVYPSLSKSVTHRKLLVHKDNYYKSTKTNVISSFDSTTSYSRKNWKKKESQENQENQFIVHKYTQKYKSDSTSHRSKHIENEFNNDIEEHENNSEFSYVTNVSNVMTKSALEYQKKDTEEIGNGSDATASTEPMEYVEVDLESLKLSDDDWKSGLSSQSSSESGAAMSKSSLQKVEITNENQGPRSIVAEKTPYLLDREMLSDQCLENDIRFEIITKKEEIQIEIECETNDSIEVDSKETKVIIEAEESTKEEQDIAIASIMLKEENDCKSPIDWESNRADHTSSPMNSVTSMFVSENLSKEINNDDFDVIRSAADIITNVDISHKEDLGQAEIKMTIPTSSSDIIETVLLHGPIVDDCNKDITEQVSEVLTPNSCTALKKDQSLDIDIISPTNEKAKEFGPKVTSQPEGINERNISSSESSQQDNNSASNSIISPGLKTQANSKVTSNTSPTVKEDLTSYVKSVIERVMQEQSVENQNKLKFDRCMNKRNKKNSLSVSAPSKPAVVVTSTTALTTPVSVSMSLQKSPSVSYQAVVIDNVEHNSSTRTVITSGTPVIPGVNVCSPVVTTIANTTKPILDVVISTISADVSTHKSLLTRPNVISIINLPVGGTPSVKIEPVPISIPIVTPSSSELKVNTDLPQLCSTGGDNTTVVTSSNSTNKSSSQLKSPSLDDQTKQRICTRLRRADPNKSDGNYKVVMTISTNNLELISNKPLTIEPDHNDQNLPKPSIKLPDNNVPIADIKLPNEKQISDPYEPNFDESPVELVHYRTKVKNTFFPSEEKSSQMTNNEESAIGVVIPSANTTTVDLNTSVSVCHPVSSTTDTLSQVIEDVAHGHFNYIEYLSSFKSGKLTSLHISPSTTPLTFVSNDSRDCSSVSADYPNNVNIDAGPTIAHRKVNSLKHNNNNHNNEDGKKADNTATSSYAHLSTVQRHSTSLGSTTCLDMSVSHNTNDKVVPINVDVNSLFTTKSTVSNVSISPVYSTSCTTQYNNEIFTLLNPAVLCRSVDSNSQNIKQMSNSGMDISQSPTLSSVQIQPFNILSSNAALQFDKDDALISKYQLNVDSSNLEQKISKNNLINISVNSVQSGSNSILSSVVQNPDDKTTFKQFYINVLQQRNTIDSSQAYSQLQNIINEAHFKSMNPATDSSLFRMSQNVNDPSSMSLPQTVPNQEPGISSMMGLPQNISSKFIAELVIPREYPLVWEGKLSLKNEEAKVALHFVHGNSDLLNACMHLLIFSGSLQWNNTGSLKIVQRMRLDTSQLEGVQRRMQNTNEYCIGLALPGGDDTNQWMRQSQILKDGFIKYMREKGAAGIINVCHPENNQQGLYVVHIFPPCDFSTNQLCNTAPQLASIIDSNKVPSLLVVITTV